MIIGGVKKSVIDINLLEVPALTIQIILWLNLPSDQRFSRALQAFFMKSEEFRERQVKRLSV